MSVLENQLEFEIRALKLPKPEREYRFAALATGGTGQGVRARLAEAGLKDWRFDFAWPKHKFAVEIEGGGWIRGRHNRPKGFADDLRKYHEGMRLGWTIYRCDASMVKRGEASQMVETMLQALIKQGISNA